MGVSTRYIESRRQRVDDRAWFYSKDATRTTCITHFFRKRRTGKTCGTNDEYAMLVGHALFVPCFVANAMTTLSTY
jgi:hypothetical protein